MTQGVRLQKGGKNDFLYDSDTSPRTYMAFVKSNEEK